MTDRIKLAIAELTRLRDQVPKKGLNDEQTREYLGMWQGLEDARLTLIQKFDRPIDVGEVKRALASGSKSFVPVENVADTAADLSRALRDGSAVLVSFDATSEVLQHPNGRKFPGDMLIEIRAICFTRRTRAMLFACPVCGADKGEPCDSTGFEHLEVIIDARGDYHAARSR